MSGHFLFIVITMPKHQQCGSVWGDDLRVNDKTRTLVASDSSLIVGRRVRLHFGDRGVFEQLLDESIDHRTSKAAAKLVGVGQKLVDSSGSRIGFLLPPAVT